MRGLHQGSNSSARLDAFIVLREIRGINETSWSDWQDSNLRPLPPQGSVLPNWTTTRYQGLLKESLNSNAFHFSLYAITMLRNLTYDVPMVGGVGFEPTHPKGPDLQSGAALQLDRPPKYIMPCLVYVWPQLEQPTGIDRTRDEPISLRHFPTHRENRSGAGTGPWRLNTSREDFRCSLVQQKSYLYAVAANSTTTITLGRGEGSWIQTKKSIKTPDLQ